MVLANPSYTSNPLVPVCLRQPPALQQKRRYVRRQWRDYNWLYKASMPFSLRQKMASSAAKARVRNGQHKHRCVHIGQLSST